MQIIDYILWVYLLAIPLYSIASHQQERQAVLNGKKTLSQSYWQHILMLWPGAILAMFSEHFSYTFGTSVDIWLLIGIIILGVLTTVFYVGIKQVTQSTEVAEKLLEDTRLIAWLMPKTQKQLALYVLGVCLTAGVAEEIIYRGYLMPFLQQHLGAVWAVIISSLLFGLPHIYQNISGVFKTAAIGALFAVTVIVFDSLWLAIALHFLIDTYAGLIYYFANKKVCS